MQSLLAADCPLFARTSDVEEPASGISTSSTARTENGEDIGSSSGRQGSPMYLLADPLNGRAVTMKGISVRKRVPLRKYLLFALKAGPVRTEQLKHALHFVRAGILQVEDALDRAACAKGTPKPDQSALMAYASRPTHAETSPCKGTVCVTSTGQ